MRLFVLALIVAAGASLGSTTPAFSQDADPESIADLQRWLEGRWVCEYSRTLKTVAIFKADNTFLWIHSIGMVPYASLSRRDGTYEIIAPGEDGHQAAVLATVQRTMPDDPEFVPGKQERMDFTRMGADKLQDSSGQCVREERE